MIAQRVRVQEDERGKVRQVCQIKQSRSVFGKHGVVDCSKLRSTGLGSPAASVPPCGARLTRRTLAPLTGSRVSIEIRITNYPATITDTLVATRLASLIVLAGNPGTGKTTVAKLYAQLLSEMNLLSKGDVVVKSPSDFIGNVTGESEKLTRDILRAAEGCVLVIDEAYSLYGGEPPGAGSSQGSGQNRFHWY